MGSKHGPKATESDLLHPRNPHNGRYDFRALCSACPELKRHLQPNPKGDSTIDFSDARAVLCLNKALLAHHYHVTNWQIPAGYLCPPIPGRADYIHYLADLLAGCHQGACPTGRKVKVLDIGTGANCIYPIIGSQSYGWQFVATEIDPVSVKTASLIVQSNACLSKLIKVTPQTDPKKIFKGMIKDKERFDLTLCNPPFHSSMAEVKASNQRKWRNLNSGKRSAPAAKLNFGGQEGELWCPGGEIVFIKNMAKESVDCAEQVCWFTSLVSKGDNIRPLKKLLIRLDTKQMEVIKMRQGQKISRFIAWSFLTRDQQASWAKNRWSRR
ncbi:MAG: 23S rRNA (adenine(1618)-N(6))-methyltransferase RlmF [Phycisphaeraceae bacterium]|nr:23S rRNA (adenine(1618)-N(6))-methyltransferase RlmF [Phycisphaeraceae bacterium]